MVEKALDFNMFVAVVNNNLIAYDQARDLASCISAAIAAQGGGTADGSDDDDELSEDDEAADRGAARRAVRRVSLESEDGVLTETAIHAEMEEACRCASLLLPGRRCCWPDALEQYPVKGQRVGMNETEFEVFGNGMGRRCERGCRSAEAS